VDPMRRALLSCAQALLGLSLVASAAADAPCAIELEGVSAAWREAASAVPELATAGDCARIVIAGAGGEGATVTFLTTDGRRASRALAHPDELAPALEALLERGPSSAAPEAASPAAALPAPAPPPATAAEPSPAAQPDAPVRDESTDDHSGAAVVFALQTGARSGSSLVSPVFVGSAALAIDRWELGVVAAYEARYFDLEARVSDELQTGALGLGVGAGRRDPVGSVTLLAGVRTMVATLTHQVVEVTSPADGPADGPGQREQSAFEWRIGGYVGAIAPRAGSVRLRAELGADIVGSERSTSFAAGYEPVPPVAPEWAITGLIGVELGGR